MPKPVSPERPTDTRRRPRSLRKPLKGATDRRIEQLCAELSRCGMRAPEAGEPIDADKLSRLVD